MAEGAFKNVAQSCLRLATSSLINYQPVRFRNFRNVTPIMGWPRKTLYLQGKKYPEPHIYNWRPYLPQDGEYTIKPLPIYKMGGRDFDSGRVVVRTLGGGNPKKFRWTDMCRKANEDGSPREERVLMLKYDPLSTPKLALVADKERTRWITATDGINVGDIIRTYSDLPRNPVRSKIGDAHPLGALPVGTKVHLIESKVGEGAKFCLAAGAYGEITKRTIDSGVTVKMRHGDQFKLDSKCMAVVGQCSNPGHENVKLMCPQRMRWLGKRPKSGQWHKKDGYCGRKIYPPRLIDITIEAIKEKEAKQHEDDPFRFLG